MTAQSVALLLGLTALINAVSALNSPSSHIQWDTIETPPYFVHEPNPPAIYFKIEKGGLDDNTILDKDTVNLLEQTIKCKAGGNPRPTYRWKKNGKLFDPKAFSTKVTQMPGEGTLIFTKLQEADAGVYQCEASNSNGTAIDRPITLEEAWIRHFVTEEPEIVKVELGDSYERNCTPPTSNPKARLYWILMGKEQGQFESIVSDHISSNDAGTLFFHYVNFTDLKENRYYTCTAENVQLKDYKFGNQFALEVQTGKRRSRE
ncbi:hypothetical protein WR25_19698 [Diploscapter pachys]|uniref:Ig-like domain-containing protein n=1 Tax=Diploscapter pachys TaxID=2018661 RepID=A0A2A2JVN6_9BILA|nr:hypothetical protein WR25_19698 [Diploscapter pachys]